MNQTINILQLNNRVNCRMAANTSILQRVTFLLQRYFKIYYEANGLFANNQSLTPIHLNFYVNCRMGYPIQAHTGLIISELDHTDYGFPRGYGEHYIYILRIYIMAIRQACRLGDSERSKNERL